LQGINCVFRLCGAAFDNVGGLCKTILDAINRKSGVRVETADMAVVCPDFQDNISALPVFCPEDDIFIA
jgi:hypothetical protein